MAKSYEELGKALSDLHEYVQTENSILEDYDSRIKQAQKIVNSWLFHPVPSDTLLLQDIEHLLHPLEIVCNS